MSMQEDITYQPHGQVGLGAESQKDATAIHDADARPACRCLLKLIYCLVAQCAC